MRKRRSILRTRLSRVCPPACRLLLCRLLVCLLLACLLLGAGAPGSGAQELPCGWAVVSPSRQDLAHPEWPRHIAPAPDGCSTGTINVPRAEVGVSGPESGDGVRISQVLVMTSDGAYSRILLRVTALESGWPGQVIRCRSSLDGRLLRGRILDAHTVVMQGRVAGGLW